MVRLSQKTRRTLWQLAVLGLGLAPLLGLIGAFFTDRLGADPVETLLHETGAWSLRLLVATLAITPLRRIMGWRQLAPHRRTLGLFSFLYALLHLVVFAVFELGLDPALLFEEIIERPYITVGFASFCILLALAITSTRGWQRRLGARWRALHRLVYLALVGGVVHFLRLVKAALAEQLVYAALATGLLGLRIYWSAMRNRPEYATLSRSS